MMSFARLPARFPFIRGAIYDTPRVALYVWRGLNDAVRHAA